MRVGRTRPRVKPWVRGPIVGVGVTCVLAVVGLVATHHVLLRAPSGGGNGELFRIDRDRSIVIWADEPIFVDWTQRHVISLDPLGFHFGAILLWRRETFDGIGVGDALKDDPKSSFRFRGNGCATVMRPSRGTITVARTSGDHCED